MGIIIDETDFVGFQELAQNAVMTPKLTLAITRWEKFYLYRILSNAIVAPAVVGFADQFIADCNANMGVPVIPRNLKIYNELMWQTGRFLHQSKGLMDIMLSLIFMEYIRMTESFSSQNGVAQANIDAAYKAKLSGAMRLGESRWNDALGSIEVIQWWMRNGDGSSGAGHGGSYDYPEYIQPQKLSARFSAIL